jgi:hypothetical protein
MIILLNKTLSLVLILLEFSRPDLGVEATTVEVNIAIREEKAGRKRD